MKSSSHKSQVPKGHTEERKPTPLLTADRVENRLKKPTTFICKLKSVTLLPPSFLFVACFLAEDIIFFFFFQVPE